MANDLHHSIHGLLGHIMRARFIRSHELFEKYKVYPGQPPLLLSLYEQDGLSQSQLAQRLHVKASTITVMIKRLEKSGMVHKVADAHDKRSSQIFLTPQGYFICEELTLLNKVHEDICVQNMSTEEQIILKRLLLQVLNNLSEPAPSTQNSTYKGDDLHC